MEVTKHRASLVLTMVLLVAVVLMAIPMTASAAIVVSGVNWYGTTYKGTDAFYGSPAPTVTAFAAGSKANVAFNIQNTFGYDVNIKSVRVKFDWGQTYDATSAPAALKAGESSVVEFAFDVPSTEGINAVLHNWELKVAYESQDASAIVLKQVDTAVGSGVANQVVTLTQTAVEPDSVVIYVNGTAWTSGFGVNLYSHSVTFTTPVTAGQNITIEYRYGELLFNGDGTLSVGYLDHMPAASCDAPFVRDSIAVQHTSLAAGAYSVDLNTGRVALLDAPTPWQSVYVSYVYYPTVTLTGTGVAVYSADQASAQALAVQLAALNANAPVFWLPLSTAGAADKTQSAVIGAQAATKYAAGDFAGAKSDYLSAVDNLTAAYAANGALSTTAETAVSALVKDAAPVIDAYANQLNGEAKSAEGQATMYRNVGVFSILLGVATLLAGLAGILWAFSRLVDARGPSHHDHHDM